MFAEPSPAHRRRKWLSPWRLGGGLVAASFVIVGLGWAASLRSDGGAVPIPLARTPVPGPPRVLAYFYYWYDLPNGAHREELTDRPPDQPRASYQNPQWFQKQLTDMADAGVDIALADYWGDAEPGSDVGLRNMSAAAAQLQRENRPSSSIAMFFDTGLIGRWPESQRDLTRAENQARVYALVQRFFTAVPREQWALIDGRPVVWMWAAYFGITFDQSLFDYLYARFRSDFGVRPYIVGEVSWAYALKQGTFGSGTRPDKSAPTAIDDFYVWDASLFGYQHAPGNIAEVGPGYDERGLRGADRTGRVAGREGGRFFERSLESALSERKQFLAVETWNEYHEASDVAESIEYGRTYMDITRRYTDRFHSAAVGG